MEAAEEPRLPRVASLPARPLVAMAEQEEVGAGEQPPEKELWAAAAEYEQQLREVRETLAASPDDAGASEVRATRPDKARGFCYSAYRAWRSAERAQAHSTHCSLYCLTAGYLSEVVVAGSLVVCLEGSLFPSWCGTAVRGRGHHRLSAI